MTIAIILFIIFEILSCLGMGLIFKKMGLGFIKGIIPFYNKLILIKKYTLPPFHFLLVFIPLISIYTSYKIYKKICEQYNKDSFYAVELAIFPFVYNFFLGLELPQEKQEEKEIKNEETEEEPKKIEEDIYTWHPKEMLKSNTVYKASRNNFGGKVNIKLNNNNEIIDNKKPSKKQKENKKECPNCSAKINESAKTCPVCGTTL